MRKMKAWTQKGVVIHDAVKAAQRGWSSFDKSKKVIKSVETSDKPRMTLKKMNLHSPIILGVLISLIQNNSPGSDISPFFFNQTSPPFRASIRTILHQSLHLDFKDLCTFWSFFLFILIYVVIQFSACHILGSNSPRNLAHIFPP